MRCNALLDSVCLYPGNPRSKASCCGRLQLDPAASTNGRVLRFAFGSSPSVPMMSTAWQGAACGDRRPSHEAFNFFRSVSFSVNGARSSVSRMRQSVWPGASSCSVQERCRRSVPQYSAFDWASPYVAMARGKAARFRQCHCGTGAMVAVCVRHSK